jgi:hypothetical protein|tara:strand:- start:2848 stop:2982 length:135 start_codon:yes stop_codon:yes gene_type:complete
MLNPVHGNVCGCYQNREAAGFQSAEKTDTDRQEDLILPGRAKAA